MIRVVTGLERIQSMTISATNSFGTTSEVIDFYMTNESADDFLAPYNLYAANVIDGGFRLGWELSIVERLLLLKYLDKVFCLRNYL